MNNLLKYLLITAISMHITGCSSLTKPIEEEEYITPLKEVSLNVGESAIINGAMKHCGREADSWLDVSYLLPNAKTGFFASAGRKLMKSEKCRGLTYVRAIKFIAKRPGSEHLDILGTPTHIVVSDSANFLQSTLPNPDKTNPSKTNPNKTKTTSSEPSMLDTVFEWIKR